MPLRMFMSFIVSFVTVCVSIGVGMKFQQNDGYPWGLLYVAVVFAVNFLTMRGMYKRGRADERNFFGDMEFFIRKNKESG